MCRLVCLAFIVIGSVLLIQLAQPDAATAAETGSLGILVVTRSSVEAVAGPARRIVDELLDLRWREGYTTRTLPVLIYDFDKPDEQKYCQTRLRVASPLPFVGVVQIVPDFMPQVVLDRMEPDADAPGAARRAFACARARVPVQSVSRTALPRADLAEMIFRLYIDLSQVSGMTSSAFRDVSAPHPNAAAIAFVAARGLMRGYPGNLFRPDAGVSRYELAALLKRVATDLGEQLDPLPSRQAPPSLVDVPKNHRAREDITFLSTRGILHGFPGGTFQGARVATVVEARKWVTALREAFRRK